MSFQIKLFNLFELIKANLVLKILLILLNIHYIRVSTYKSSKMNYNFNYSWRLYCKIH